MALKCMADNNVNITCQEDARMYDYLAGGNSDYIIKNIGQELNINYSSTTLLVTLGSGEGVLQGRHISNSDSSSVKITLSQNTTAYLVIRYDLSQPVGSEASFCSTSVLENDDLNNKGVKRDLLIGKYTANSEGVTNFVDMRNYTLQNKKYLYETFARIPKIKRNLSVMPIVNDDVSTNKYYPYKYTVNFVGTKADDLASASLAIGVECEEFKGTNTVTDGVELLFSALPKENVLFSFVQVANEGTFSELTNNVEQIELNKRNISTNTQDITKLKNDINTLSNIKADGIICTTENKLINVKDSSNLAFNEFNVYGESSQAATPTPDNPQEIVNKVINKIEVSNNTGVKQTINLSQPITLCGLKSEQSNITIDGQKYISDVITEKNGVYGVERNINGVVLNGNAEEKWVVNENWTNNSQLFCVYISNLTNIDASSLAIVCEKLTMIPRLIFSPTEDGTIFKDSLTTKVVYISISKSRLSTITLNGFIEWLKNNNLKIKYKLATPIFEPLPIADQQALKQLHSFYPNTIITNNDNAFMKLNYVADTKMYIDNKIAEIVNQKVV